MTELRTWIASYSNLNDEAWTALHKVLRPLELKKNATFQKAHRPAERMGFLLEGALYANYADEQRKHSVAFFCLNSVNRVVCDLEAYTENSPARMSIVATVPSKLLVVERKDLYALYEQHPAIERLGRRLAEYSYARAMERIGRMQLKNPERAADLFQRYREVFLTFPNKLIAQYLGMSEGELCRAKRKLNGKH